MFAKSALNKSLVDDDLDIFKTTKKPTSKPIYLNTTYPIALGASSSNNNTTTSVLICDDALIRICEYLFLNHHQVITHLATVSRGWYQFFTSERSNLLWRRLAKQRWLALNETMAIKNWHMFFKRRVMKMKKKVASDKKTTALTVIDNCDLEYECPIAFVRYIF